MIEMSNLFGTLDGVAILCGVVLLALGRRLFWLALGAVGFVVGVEIAGRIGLDASETVRLVFGFVLGVAGALLAVAAQRLAITLGGILVGGLGLLWLAQPWVAELGPWIWAVAAVGAIAGVGLAQMVFQVALVVLTSVVGAGLLVEGLDPIDSYRPWLFLAFTVVGLVLQSRSRKRRD